MIVTIELPIEVKKIIERLNNSNFECYVVGGAIRDNLLNRSIEDYDLTTNASVEEIKRIFFDHKTIEINEKRETIAIIKDDLSIEVTTYRNKEGFTIRGDLSLRDFTINALAYNHKVGLLDYFNSLEDSNNKVIRTVNEPGDDVIIPPAGSCGAAKKRMEEDNPNMYCLDWFMCFKNERI